MQVNVFHVTLLYSLIANQNSAKNVKKINNLTALLIAVFALYPNPFNLMKLVLVASCLNILIFKIKSAKIVRRTIFTTLSFNLVRDVLQISHYLNKIDASPALINYISTSQYKIVKPVVAVEITLLRRMRVNAHQINHFSLKKNVYNAIFLNTLISKQNFVQIAQCIPFII